jgi:hypothetical protein
VTLRLAALMAPTMVTSTPANDCDSTTPAEATFAARAAVHVNVPVARFAWPRSDIEPAPAVRKVEADQLDQSIA